MFERNEISMTRNYSCRSPNNNHTLKQSTFGISPQKVTVLDKDVTVLNKNVAVLEFDVIVLIF